MMRARSVQTSRVGLVEAVHPNGSGHVYAAGAVPAGRLVRELGALRSEAGPATRPVWITSDGRLVSEDYVPRPPRPSLVARLRWLLAPLRWREPDVRGRRIATAAWRARRARSLRPPASPERPDEAPSGHISTRPVRFGVHLHAGVHPITGDQRLGTLWELVDSGYEDVVDVGWLDNRAEVTGTLETLPVELPWASRLGRAVAPPREDFTRPCGSFVGPFDDERDLCLPLVVEGWALFPDEAVSRVEVTVDGRPVGRARTGYHSPELARLLDSPDACIAGWQLVLTERDVGPRRRRFELGGTVHGTSGDAFALAPVAVELDPPRASAPAAEAPPRGPAPPVARPRTGEPLRVLAFTHDLGRGGAQLFFLELLRRIVPRLDASCTVVSPGDGPLRAELERAGIAVHVSPPAPVGDAPANAGRIAAEVAWAAPQEFDVALVNSILAHQGVAVAERLGIPALLFVHESLRPDEYWVGMPDAHPDVRAGLERALTGAAITLFEAEATRDLLLPWGRRDRFRALPYGIELGALETFRAGFDRAVTRRRRGLPADARVVLCLGSVEPRKAQVSLTRAFDLVAQRHPDAVLALVGLAEWEWTRSYTDGLRRYVARAGLSPRTRIVQMDERPWEWIAAADLLVCASDVESLPRAVLEAMALGTPVVASRAFGLAEAVEDGTTGYVCDPRDVGSLARALDRALSAPASELHGVAAAAGRRVRERHDPARYAAAVSDIVAGLVADARPEGRPAPAPSAEPSAIRPSRTREPAIPAREP